MLHNLKMQWHMFTMRYLVYRDELKRALSDAHREMVEYSEALMESVARTPEDLD